MRPRFALKKELKRSPCEMTPELLSPAKNLDFGREAINHGADALYIGAPAFGARAAATNTVADIEALVGYAHTYRAKVYATVNTLLFDSELEEAVRMIRRLYEVGVDALIIQDMGLLECDLPPIELHASTQCHNAELERIKFLEGVGFSRIVLARETSIEQMRRIGNECSVELEAFVHGALCVSYSGQCYMSQYLNGRSGNRGCCSQPCRSAYDLYTDSGRLLKRDFHPLSLKDFNASQHLEAMLEAGICSLKIEGRLKDLSYVKNVTAYYRQLLDSLLEGRPRSSSGRCKFYFTPDLERTFNRGYTDYFLIRRQPMASLATQKSIGKPVGKVAAVGRKSLVVDGECDLSAGDGLCYFSQEGVLMGFAVNQVSGNEVFPNKMPTVRVGTRIWRNHDHQFEKLLQGKSGERRIGVEMVFKAVCGGFGLWLRDEDGVEVDSAIEAKFEQSNDAVAMSQLLVRQLSKLGGTPLVATAVSDETEGRYFLPASVINRLRTSAVEKLIGERQRLFRPAPWRRVDRGLPYPAERLDSRANVVNSLAEMFYKIHGVRELARGVELTCSYGDMPLMTTKYCLRYELGCCLRGKGGKSDALDVAPSDGLMLHNNGKWFRLKFDCENCRMGVYSY
ncbi:MAG: U32 family peptidase [Bacteroidales bacterium]|nr:U32 family peptidase [Bacteroidales bacterium]